MHISLSTLLAGSLASFASAAWWSNAESGNSHSHLDFHRRLARSRIVARDGHTDALLNRITGGQAWTGSAAQKAAAQQANVVVDVVTVTADPAAPDSAPAPAPAAPAPVAPAPVAPAQNLRYVIPGATPNEDPAPAPAANPSPDPAPAAPANPPAGGNAPKNFVAGLDTTSAEYKAITLVHHNVHRANHSVPDLVWNDTLAGYAKETAESCIYGHSLAPGGGGYGQNIAAGDAPGNLSAILSNGFYNAEIGLFLNAIGGTWGSDEPNMADFEKWGHATQMVWKDTKSVACYTATCSPPGANALDCNPGNGQSYLKNVGCGNGGTPAYNTVCNYYPPGNYAHKYSAVQATKGQGLVAMTGEGVIGL